MGLIYDPLKLLNTVLCGLCCSALVVLINISTILQAGLSAKPFQGGNL